MKPLLTCLTAIAFYPIALIADDVIVNSITMPDEVVAFCMDDAENTGAISDDPGGKVNPEAGAFQIGDVGNPNVSNRVRKGFVLFHLPAPDGKKLSRATLRLYATRINREASDKPLPPLWLVHAENWRDDLWTSDVRWRGLATSHFADDESFSKKLQLLTSDDKPGPIEVDVTEMIQADYQRTSTPVAAFRFEISDREALDITDGLVNSYVIVGPGVRAQPERVPALTLTFE
jgi:hypothetical protein